MILVLLIRRPRWKSSGIAAEIQIFSVDCFTEGEVRVCDVLAVIIVKCTGADVLIQEALKLLLVQHLKKHQQ